VIHARPQDKGPSPSRENVSWRYIHSISDRLSCKKFKKLRSNDVEKIRCGRRHFETLSVAFDDIITVSDLPSEIVNLFRTRKPKKLKKAASVGHFEQLVLNGPDKVSDPGDQTLGTGLDPVEIRSAISGERSRFRKLLV